MRRGVVGRKTEGTGDKHHDVLTDLNLMLPTFHRFDMNSSKSWSSESNRHWKAYVKVAAIDAPALGADANTRELGVDSDQPDV
jgi:hypothetical protein